MSVKNEAAEYMSVLSTITADPRYQALFQFAKRKGLGEGTVTLPNQKAHSAAAYAMQVYCNATELANPENEEASIPYLIVAILMALEASGKCSWSTGGKLIYEVGKAGITLKRSEVKAFIAQRGTFQSNFKKLSQMENNLLAVSLHCGDLITRLNTLPGVGNGLRKNSMGALKEALEPMGRTDTETLEQLAKTYIGALLGQKNLPMLERFLKWLRSTDYYYAPASVYGLHNFAGGLAFEKVETIYHMARLLLPATEEQIGEIVMAVLCCDMHKVNVFRPDGSGHFEYRENPELDLGEDIDSLYVASMMFKPLLPESVAAALNAYGYDIDTNPCVELQMMEYPLALYLHVGTFLAALLRSPREQVPANPQ